MEVVMVVSRPRFPRSLLPRLRGLFTSLAGSVRLSCAGLLHCSKHTCFIQAEDRGGIFWSKHNAIVISVTPPVSHLPPKWRSISSFRIKIVANCWPQRATGHCLMRGWGQADTRTRGSSTWSYNTFNVHLPGADLECLYRVQVFSVTSP